MNKRPGMAEDFMFPEEKSIVILKTYGGEQLICQLPANDFTPEDSILIQNPYTVDNDALYGKWITGLHVDDQGNDPHIYEFPNNQIAAMIPEARIHSRLLEAYKRSIGLLPAKFRRRGPAKI